MAPVVTSLAVSEAVVNEGELTFTFTITFDQAMQTSPGAFPVISFPTAGENPAGTFSFDFANSGWVTVSGNTVFNAVYTTTDVNIDVADIDIEITNAENTSGDTMTPYAQADVFSVDTLIATLGTPDLVSDMANDTGVDQSDNITSNDAPSFTIDLSSYTIGDGEELEAGDIIQLTNSDGTVVYGSHLMTGGESGSVAVSIGAGSPLPEGDTDLFVTVVDNAGNTTTGTNSLAVTVDTVAPTVTGLVLSDTAIAEGDAGASVTLTITFSEDMDQSVNPMVTSNAGSTLTNASGSWVNAATFVVSYTVADADVELGDVTFDVSGAQDIAGNPVTAVTGVSTDTPSSIDTIAPEASIALDANITTDDIINAAEAGGTVTITGTVGDDVAIGDPVTLTLDGAPLGSGSVVDLGGGALGFSIDVAGSALAGASATDITASVTATDAAGNTTNATDSEGYTVDTVAPTVTGLVLSDTAIAEGDAGVSVTLTITFSEDMDQTVDPTIASNASSTLTAASGMWTNATTYTVTYTVADVDVELTGVTFDVSGAQDIAANPVTAVTGVSTDTPSSIDTIAPEAPALNLFDTDTAGTGINDGTPTLSGTGEPDATISISYFDDVTPLALPQSGDAAIIVDSNGDWTYTPSSPLVAEIGEHTLTFTVTQTDIAGNEGAAVTDTIELDFSPEVYGFIDNGTIDGDAANNGTGTATEQTDESPATATGQILFEDIPTGQTYSVTIAPATPGAVGLFTAEISDQTLVDTTGAVTWNFSVDNALIDNLGAGDSIDQIYGVTITDSNGDATTQEITVTIQGTNDAPIISGEVQPLGITEVINASAQPLSVSGSFDVTDADFGGSVAGQTFDADTLMASVADASVEYTASGDAPTTTLPNGVSVASLIAAANISFTNNAQSATGSAETFNYNFATTADIDWLGAGDTLELTFPVTVGDGTDTATTDITITITGTNDVPVAVAAVNAVDEDATIMGSVSGTDADTGETATLTYALVDPAPTGLTFNTDGTYTFDASSYDSLPADVDLVLTIPFTTSDATSTSASADLVITITGTNDVPVAAADFATAVEDSVFISGDLSLNDLDVDQGDEFTYILDTNIPGLVINTDGTYTFDPTNAAYDHLAQGAEEIVVANISVSDSIETVSTTLTITVSDTDDAPVAVADTISEVEGNVVNGSVATNDNPVDDGSVLQYVLDSPIDGLTLNSDGSYSFDGDVASYDYLNDTDTLTLNTTYTVTDQFGSSDTGFITITIDGANDAAIVSGVTSGTAAEDSGVSATGTLTASDVDNDDDVFQAGSGTGSAGYGTFTVTAAGEWTYTIDDSNTDVDALNVGESLTDTFDVLTQDGTVQAVTITIDGANSSLTEFDDVYVGTEFDDVIDALAGDDIIAALGGNDTISDGSGNDQVDGGIGDDTFIVGTGANDFDGGDGEDTLDYSQFNRGLAINLATGENTGGQSGNAGSNDTFINFENVFGGNGGDILTGTSGNNTLYGNAGDDIISDAGGDDIIDGGDGDDLVIVGTGANTLEGGLGNDTLDYSAFNRGLAINLATGDNTGGQSGNAASNDTFSNFENVIGGNGTDILTGTSEDNLIVGNSGSDTLYGLAGNDTIFDGSGNDMVFGGAGDDFFGVGTGANTINGGDGSDTVDYSSFQRGLEINLTNGTTSGGTSGNAASNDVLVEIENIIGSNGSDRLFGDNADNTFEGGTGNDTLSGRDGNDTMIGGDGNDRLFGGSGSDVLLGGDGDDFFDGGAGQAVDFLTGGVGADIFHFDRGEGIDVITDFEIGVDTLQFDNFSYLSTEADILNYASEANGNVVIDFGNDGNITVENVSLAELQNDFEIV